MSNVKKLLMAAAGNAGGAGLDVTEVFSTYLYTGTGAAQTISNGIDLNGEGGLLVTKNRTDGGSTAAMQWTTTEYNLGRSSESDSTNEYLNVTAFTLPSAGGYTINTTNNRWNGSGRSYVSYSWRQAPKFFDALTYTGNGSSQNISHNLGSVPGMIICKNLDGPEDWWVYHRSVGNTGYLELNQISQTQTTSTAWNNTTPTSTQFTVGSGNPVNENNKPYMAFLFAHNDGDGGFGPNGDQDIIKCGTMTGDQFVDLGFEPQFVMYKRSDGSSGWYVQDMVRGMSEVYAAWVRTNYDDAESTSTTEYITPRPTGFDISNFGASSNYIYVAVRRGPLAQPTTASSVFNCEERSNSNPFFRSNSVADGLLYTLLHTTNATYPYLSARLINTETNRTYNPPGSTYTQSYTQWDYINGVGEGGSQSNHFGYIWSRAPGFFDVVSYTMSTSGGNINHNLGVAPEMMWVKARDFTDHWYMYHIGLNGGTNPEEYYIPLSSTGGEQQQSNAWNDTAPTASVFTVGASGGTGTSGRKYIAYLFATLEGISKVGYYTGDGTTDGSKVIDCGFTNGAKLVIIRPLPGFGCYVFDSVRGISSGSNDPWWRMDFQMAENTSLNMLGTNSSGFTVKNSNVNTNGTGYTFYAVAI